MVLKDFTNYYFDINNVGNVPFEYNQDSNQDHIK